MRLHFFLNKASDKLTRNIFFIYLWERFTARDVMWPWGSSSLSSSIFAKTYLEQSMGWHIKHSENENIMVICNKCLDTFQCHSQAINNLSHSFGWICWQQGWVVRLCEHGNEPSGDIKSKEPFLTSWAIISFSEECHFMQFITQSDKSKLTKYTIKIMLKLSLCLT
jgi:hypothetical protein